MSFDAPVDVTDAVVTLHSVVPVGLTGSGSPLISELSSLAEKNCFDRQ